MIPIIVAGGILGVLGLAACGGSADAGGSDQTEVVAAFYPLAFAAQEIGGAAVDVHNMTPTGAEPHDLELTPSDVEDVRNADVVLYLGEGFQPALEDAVAGASGAAVDLLDGIALHEGEGGEEGHEEGHEHALDPHVWLDPVLYAGMVERIGEALGKPEQAAGLVDELHALDGEFASTLASCDRNVIVTSHAAFGYLAERYGLEQIAVGGLSPEAEPTPRELEQVIDRVRDSGATTVFFETLVSPEVAETVARETGAKAAKLDPLEGLTSDEQSAGEDYFSIMRQNLAALRDALGCR
jgi:zinc transport system substrate-binding protein